MKTDQISLETQFFSARHFTQTAQEPGEGKDLGLGSDIIVGPTKRFVNRDGTFNVKKAGSGFFGSQSFYQYLLNISWKKFFALTLLVYISINVVFGLAYFLAGPEALDGISREDKWSRCLSCFFFSIQTFATIGYGQIAPHGLTAHILVTIEALFGLIGFAVATGLVFARFSKPSAKIIFSKQAIIGAYRGGRAFQFRIINARQNQLFHLEARVVMSRMEQEGFMFKRKFHDLALERRQVMFFPLSLTVVHPIDESSPLFGITEDQLAKSDAEFLVMLQGVDDTFSQSVYAWSSYKFDEIIWDAKYANIAEYQKDGSILIDAKRIDEIDVKETQLAVL